MNLRHQETFCIILLLSTVSITFGQDFQFASDKEEDEVQPMLAAESLDVVSKAQPIKSIYSKEKAQCPPSQNKIMLSLVLRSHSWDDIVEKKRQKAVNKLSKFFLIPKENFIIDDAHRVDLHEMSSKALQRGRNNLSSNKRKLGRVGFLIGCGKTIFPSEKLIANTIGQQMKERALDDISGLEFGWWSIWNRHPTADQDQQQHQTRRVKRQNNQDDYENDDDYDYNYDDEDEAEPTEVPQHAHRHHHGDSSTADKEEDLPTVLLSSMGTSPVTASSTISITSAASIPTDSQTITSQFKNVATTTSLNRPDLSFGLDEETNAEDEVEEEEDEYEDTVIITELPNSVAPAAPAATTSTAAPTTPTVPTTVRTTTETEMEATSTVSDIPTTPTVESLPRSLPVTTTPAVITTTATTETPPPTTTQLELVTAPSVVLVETTTAATSDTAMTTSSTTTSLEPKVATC